MRKQYSITTETWKKAKTVKWGGFFPSEFPFGDTFGRIKIDSKFDIDLLKSLRKRDLQRFYLCRYGKNTPKGSSTEDIIHLFVTTEEHNKAIAEREGIEITFYPDKEEGHDDSAGWTEEEPDSYTQWEEQEAVFVSNELSLSEEIDELKGKMNFIIDLLMRPLLAAKAVGESLGEQVAKLDEIPDDLEDKSLAELQEIQERFDIPKIVNIHACKLSILNRKRHLAEVKKVSLEHSLSIKDAEKVLNCHEATGFPMKQVINFLVHK